MCKTIKEIDREIKLIEAETLIIKQLRIKYQAWPGKKKRDIIGDYLKIKGGLPFIYVVFGSIENFLICLGPESYQAGFCKQYIYKLGKVLKELEKEMVELNG